MPLATRSRRPRIVLGAAVLVAIAVAVVIRQRSGPSESFVAAVPALVEASRPGRPVVFLGLDGVDWTILDRHMAAGAMPNLAGLVREGVRGDLSSLHPPLSPLVWTTMMTGSSPLEHGILDFTRKSPVDGREEPITSDERRVPAVWNMASAAGRRVVVVGLWATYPAEAVNGILVSDRFVPSLLRPASAGPGLVFPEERTAWATSLREEAEAAIALPEVRAFLPWLDEAAWRKAAAAANPYADPVLALRRILVETRLSQALGMQAVRREKPDLAIVYFEGTDAVGHSFAPFGPPRLPSVSAMDFERYRDVGERYFRHVDGLIGEWKRHAAERGAVLFLASDHGFSWSDGRPARVSSFAPGTASEWHRPEGMYLLWGPGVAPQAGLAARGRVDQVTETLLALLGLPPASARETLAGVPRPSAPPFAYASHYHRPPPAPVVAADPEALERLRALGYLGSGAPSAKGTPASTRTASSWANECLILRREGRADPALAAARAALAVDEGHALALWCESDLLFARGDLDRADAGLVRAVRLGIPDGLRLVGQRAAAHQKASETPRAARLVAAVTQARPDDAEAWRLRASIALGSGDCAGAGKASVEALRLVPEEPSARQTLAVARLCAGDEAGARAALTGSGGDLREAFLGLAEMEIRRNRPRDALRWLEKVPAEGGQSPPLPNQEFLRGEALARLDRASEAEAAFRAEIAAFPKNTAAYQRLALVLALARRDGADIRRVVDAMYASDPTPKTAQLAARTLRAIGDEEGALAFGAAPAATPE